MKLLWMVALAALLVTTAAAPTDLKVENLDEDVAVLSEPKPRFG